MTPDPKVVRIFISSPSDVMKEREIAERVIARLDGIWKARVRLRAIRWEHAHYDMHQSFQEAIGDISGNDLVCGSIHPNITTRPDGRDGDCSTLQFSRSKVL
jgi:hypothetical protein